MNRLAFSLFIPFAVLVLLGWLVSGPLPPAVTAEEPALKLGEERTPADEVKVIKGLVDRQVEDMKNAPTQRGAHAKSHGCVEAEFTVHPNVPKEYQVGIFKEAKSFKAMVRFSNGTGSDDRKPDAHGMAIKVLGVKGPRAVEDGKDEQDFVLTDAEEFFAPDAKTMLAFMKARAAAAADPKAMDAFFADHPNVMKALKIFVKAAPPSPLTPAYFSSVPYKLGGGAVKYAAKPADENGPGDAKRDADNYLRAALVARLAAGKPAAVFEMSIVPQTDPQKMPVEDPTVHWDSKPVPVATIKIAAQEFDTAERAKVCEGASFSPWNALADHRPLGGINRARKDVYAASVKLRQDGKP